LPSDIVEIDDRYYILATSSLADEQDRVLKQGETFAVFDRYGDIKPVGLGEEGIYHEDTRFLSGLLLRLARERPMLLSSTIRQDNALMAVDLTNPDISDGGGELLVPRGTLHIARHRLPVGRGLPSTHQLPQLRPERGRRADRDPFRRGFRGHLRGAGHEARAARHHARHQLRRR